MSQKKISRRDFNKTAAGIAIGSAMLSIGSKKILGANDRINLATIGFRGQGGAHIRDFSGIPDVHYNTICDVDENLFAESIKYLEENHGYKPKTEWDLRKVYDDKDIDAVTIATPNHWHALATIWACQAGKHVYVEKPSCHNIWEGRKMVEAARKYDVCVQVGFQNRSRKNTRAAIQFIHDGKLGQVYMARGLCFKWRYDIGKYPDGPMVKGETFSLTKDATSNMPAYTEEYLKKVHYDLWMGPAKELPFNRNRFHYNWHWQWEYGNGDTGNQGPHQFDVANWGLNKQEYPVKVSSRGGNFVFDSAQNTPNTQTTVLEYADGSILEFATRGLITNAEGEQKIGVIFYGSEGWLEIDAEGNWKTFFGRNGEPGPTSEQIEEEESDASVLVGTGAGGHYGNFIYAVKNNDQNALTCDVEVGHESSCLAHMGNIAYRVGWDLKFDGRKEQFVDDDVANELLMRDYRYPYVVPEKV